MVEENRLTTELHATYRTIPDVPRATADAALDRMIQCTLDERGLKPSDIIASETWASGVVKDYWSGGREYIAYRRTITIPSSGGLKGE